MNAGAIIGGAVSSLSPENEKLAGDFKKVLDSHGYSFQYAVLKAAEGFFASGESRWGFEVAELPVDVGGRSTRIDFVLRHPGKGAFLVAECKRANPAIARWCFAKAPMIGRNLNNPLLMWERVRRLRDELRSEGFGTQYYDEAYHVGCELKTLDAGESGTGGRGAIEGGLTQVVTGTNGFTNFLAQRPMLIPDGGAGVIVPVIFTTAELYVSDVALDSADVATGRLLGPPNMRRVPWLIYQCPQSADLMHQVPGNRVTESVARILEVDLVRSVAIVSPEGIASFLEKSPDLI